MKYFNDEELITVNHAVSVAEDVISDRYQLTISSWKKFRYNIRTLKDLKPNETVPDVFAQIIRYSRPAPPDGMREGEFYSICLQDHNILEALKRDSNIKLLPLLVYVMTHELIHIVRFYKFDQFFDAAPREKEKEEARVHQLTYEILNNVKLPDIPMVLEYYARHRELID